MHRGDDAARGARAQAPAPSLGTQAADLGVDREAELVLARMLVQQIAHVDEGSGRDRCGRFDASHLTFVLHDAQRLDDVLGRHELGDVGEPPVGHGALLRPCDRVRFEAQAPDARGRGTEDLRLSFDRETDADVGEHTRGGQLVGGLVAVPPIGDEQQLVGQYEQERGAAREPCEIADVDELRDEQGVDVEALTQPHHAGGDIHRGQRDHPSSFLSA